MSNNETLQEKQEILKELEDFISSFPNTFMHKISDLLEIPIPINYGRRVLTSKRECWFRFSYFRIVFTVNNKELLTHFHVFSSDSISQNGISRSTFRENLKELNTLEKNIDKVTFEFINEMFNDFHQKNKLLNKIKKEVQKLEEKKSLDDNKSVLNKLSNIFNVDNKKYTEKDLPIFNEYVSQEELDVYSRQNTKHPYLKPTDVSFELSLTEINNNLNRERADKFFTINFVKDKVVFELHKLHAKKQSNGIRYYDEWNPVAKKKALDLLNNKIKINGSFVTNFKELPFYLELKSKIISSDSYNGKFVFMKKDFLDIYSTLITGENINNF